MWDELTPMHLVGLNTAQAPAPSSGAPIPSVARSAGPGRSEEPPPWSSESPLFWFGLIAAATLGFVAFGTSVRVGSARASVGVGQT